jgi:hypothetical protein
LVAGAGQEQTGGIRNDINGANCAIAQVELVEAHFEQSISGQLPTANKDKRVLPGLRG